MPLTPDTAAFQKRLAALPLATYQAGETVLTAGSTTGRLLILKEGAVEVVKEGVQIAKVAEPGAVFGELSVLLDKPHTADGVRWKQKSQHLDHPRHKRVDSVHVDRPANWHGGRRGFAALAAVAMARAGLIATAAEFSAAPSGIFG